MGSTGRAHRRGDARRRRLRRALRHDGRADGDRRKDSRTATRWSRRCARWRHSVGEQARAVLCAEIGGLNALLPLVLGARCGLPVVDGDGMGRAFPQLQMTTYHICGIQRRPDGHGGRVFQHGRRSIRPQSIEVERLGRSMVVAMGGSTNICLYPMRGRDAKRSIVRGTLSLALGPRPHGARGARQERRPVRGTARLPAQHRVLQALPRHCSKARPSTCCARRRPAGRWARS